MSSPQDEDAERKFWRLPELVEMVMPFLDGPSILSLAKALPLALDHPEKIHVDQASEEGLPI